MLAQIHLQPKFKRKAESGACETTACHAKDETTIEIRTRQMKHKGPQIRVYAVLKTQWLYMDSIKSYN